MVSCCLLKLDVVKPGIIVEWILLDLLLVCEAPLAEHNLLNPIPEAVTKVMTKVTETLRHKFNMPLVHQEQQATDRTSIYHLTGK